MDSLLAWRRALGGMLVCETGNSPSRLVDRLVSQGLVQRDTDPDDRRYLALSLTAEGKVLSKRIVVAEDALHDAIDQLVAGQPVDETITTMHAVASAFSAGQALARRRAAQEGLPMEQASLAINGSPATYCSTRSLCRCGTRLSSASTVLPPPLSACGTHCGLAPA